MADDHHPGLAARRLAATILDRSLTRAVTIDDALAAEPEVQTLSARDRAFLMTMVLTFLRHRGEAEAVVAQFMDKPLPKRAGRTPLILALGAVQLLFLDQPPHAVIDLAVRQAKADKNALHFAGLVNAVLRRVAERGHDVLKTLDGPRLNTPDWLWQRWLKAYGADAAHAIAAAQMAEPALDLSVKDDAADWAQTLGGTLLPGGSIRLTEAGAVDLLPGFVEGAWWVQDAAAAMPARLLGDVRGLDVLDLCAAPGGKTLQLAAAAAHVTAIDISEQRLARLRENLTRTGLDATVIAADALTFEPDGAFDAILLDAPCSATGTIRRHPELPYIKDGQDISRLVPLQRKFLTRAASWLKPGGRMVFCTCSLESAEGERQRDAFLASNPSFSLDPIAVGEAGIPAHMLTADGCLRTLPSHAVGQSQGLDGFFAMRLRRVS